MSYSSENNSLACLSNGSVDWTSALARGSRLRALRVHLLKLRSLRAVGKQRETRDFATSNVALADLLTELRAILED